MKFKLSTIVFVIDFATDGISDTLLHLAVREGNVRKVKALVKLGASINKTTIIKDGKNTITNVTSINSAIFYKNPEILAALLCFEQSASSIDTRCRDIKDLELSSIDLALKIFQQEADDNTKTVR